MIITTITIIIIINTIVTTVQLHPHVSIYIPQTPALPVYDSRSIPGPSHRTGRFRIMLSQPKRTVRFRLRKRRVCVRQRIIPVLSDAVFTRTLGVIIQAPIRILQLVSTCVDLLWRIHWWGSVVWKENGWKELWQRWFDLLRINRGADRRLSQDLVVSPSWPRLKIFDFACFRFSGLILLITLLRWLIYTHCVDLPPDRLIRRSFRLKRVISGKFWEHIDESDIGENRWRISD